MKKSTLLLGCAAFCLLNANAQQPLIYGDALYNKITGNGNVIYGQLSDSSAAAFDLQTGQQFYYYMNYPGGGYAYSDNGIFVGQTVDMKAQIMINNMAAVPSTFRQYNLSVLESITPDGSRATGLIADTDLSFELGYTYIPIVVDIDENGEAGQPVMLPCPSQDFFGARPQFCNAVWISTDGKTIGGMMVDSRGFYCWPIFYRQNDNGAWDYYLPSADLFNPKGIIVPEYPGTFFDVFPDAVNPVITNYMSPEKKQEWEQDMKAYEESDDPSEALNPWDNILYYMSIEQIEEYNAAVELWNNMGKAYDDMMDDYEKSLMAVISSSAFFQYNSMVLSPDGNKLVMAGSGYTDLTDIDSEYTSGFYMFDISSTEEFPFTMIPAGREQRAMIPSQLQNDGTLVVSSGLANAMAGNLNPSISFIANPDSEEFLSTYDYLQTKNPYYANWLKDNYTKEIPVAYDEYGNMIYEPKLMSGQVNFSSDMNSMVGAVESYLWDDPIPYTTYVIRNLDPAGVETVGNEVKDDTFRVYNIQGINVLNTKDASAINELPKGIYIVNGKKVAVK